MFLLVEEDLRVLSALVSFAFRFLLTTLASDISLRPNHEIFFFPISNMTYAPKSIGCRISSLIFSNINLICLAQRLSVTK